MSYETVFERCELKYLVTHEIVARVLEGVAPFVEPDPYNGDVGYPVTSLYYDSPTFAAFWEKLDGLPRRRKLRVRVYPAVDPHMAYLEVKERVRHSVLKRRRRAPLADVLAFLESKGRHPVAEALGPVGEEAIGLLIRERVAPKVFTLYRRQGWFDSNDRSVRITVDRDLRYRGYLGEFTCDRRRDPFLFEPWQAVLEVKASGGVPRWLSAALNAQDLNVRRLSKYCAAVDARHFGRRMV